MKVYENRLGNFYRHCHRSFRNEATARSYKSNLNRACAAAEENGYDSFLSLRTEEEVLGQLAQMRAAYLLSSDCRSAVIKYATYLATFRRAAA